MADGLKAALQSKLVAYESAGMTDLAKRVKARIAELEKGGQKPVGKLPMVLTPEQKPVDVPVGATLTKIDKPKPTVKKAKKATKALKPRKR